MRTAERLRLIRSARAARAAGRSRGDVAYAAYVAILLALLVAFPVLRQMVDALAAPSALAVLSSPGAGAGVALGLLVAGAVWLGRLYGPVTLEPASVRLLAGTDLPRHATLARPFAARAAIVVAVLAGAAAMVGGVLVHAGAASWPAGLRFVAMSVGLGVLVAVGWLAGQALGRRAAGAIGAGIAAIAVLGGLAEPAAGATPWGWVADAWPSAVPAVPAWLPAVQAAALLIACTAAAASVPPLLDLLTAERLTEDAERWRAAGMAAATGNVAHALDRLRSRPAVGRGWRAVRTDHVVTRFMLRDVIGGLRTPVRFSLGVLTLAVVGALLAVSPTMASGWVVGGVAGGLGFLALGVLADGLRHAADVAAGPALYGYSRAGLFALHAVVPVAATVSAAGSGLALALALGADVNLLAGVLVMLVVVAVRAYDSARGPLPVALLTPIPGPFGDLSGLVVAAWQADALLIASGTGALMAAGIASGPVGGVVLGVVLCGLLGWATRRRVDRR